MPIKTINFRCNGCGQCEISCPSDVIRIQKDGKAHIVYQEDCRICMACYLSCPRDAIEIAVPNIGYFDQPWRKNEKKL